MLFYGHTMRLSFIPQQTGKSASVSVPPTVVDRLILWCVGEALAPVRCQGAFSRFRAIP